MFVYGARRKFSGHVSEYSGHVGIYAGDVFGGIEGWSLS
jgi:hypothetical protein